MHSGIPGNLRTGGCAGPPHRGKRAGVRHRARGLIACPGDRRMVSGHRPGRSADHRSAGRAALAGSALPPRSAGGGVSHRRQFGRRDGKSLRPGRLAPRARPCPGTALLPRVSCRYEPGRHGGRRIHIPAHLGVHVAHIVGAGDGASPASRQRPRGIHLPADGEPRHAFAAALFRPPGGSRRRLRVRRDSSGPSLGEYGGCCPRAGAARGGLEGRARAAPCLVATGASGRAEPRLRTDERRDDQGGGLWLRAHRVRPDGTGQLVVGCGGAPLRRPRAPCWACSTR